ncbi:hypothetical protein LWC34_43290 [Kibdelosporangium philippinense]|uniref:Uncharacterized protein n=1 Tax=Kibdelosporangium philippinense TaxID=211113 RepID=A0ABS8ZP98_9PSEU|nr:hypothetical protein [Kibdelosporangium philippinense]MCE7009589.1 hypothetical protein [Kibdelosporangium philippinense]
MLSRGPSATLLRVEDAANKDVIVRLTADEALVLSDWLYRLGEEGGIDDDAIWRVVGTLETSVAAIFGRDYYAQLADARLRILKAPRKTVVGWLKLENLKGFLIVLSNIVSYRFDDFDWGAFEAGLEPAADDEWFTYPLVGNVTLEVAISRDIEEDHVTIRVDVPPGAERLIGQIETAWMIFTHFTVSPDVMYFQACSLTCH